MSTRPRTLDLGLLVLRLVTGGLMLVGHGWGKFRTLLAGGKTEWADPIGLGPELSFALAATAESVAAVGIMVGLLSRLSTAGLAFTMAVAAFVVHGGDPFAKQELALFYLGACVTLLLTGPGRYTLQARLFKTPSNPVLRRLLA